MDAGQWWPEPSFNKQQVCTRPFLIGWSAQGHRTRCLVGDTNIPTPLECMKRPGAPALRGCVLLEQRVSHTICLCLYPQHLCGHGLGYKWQLWRLHGHRTVAPCQNKDAEYLIVNPGMSLTILVAYRFAICNSLSIPFSSDQWQILETQQFKKTFKRSESFPKHQISN